MGNNFLQSGGQIKKPNETHNVVGDGSARLNDQEIEKYRDLHGVTVNRLNIGLWYVENKNRINKIILWFFIIASVVTWGYVIYGLGSYYTFGIRTDEKMYQQIASKMVVGHDYVSEVGAKDLIIQSTRILPAGKDKYDFIVRIYNPNQNHHARFDYNFLIDSDKQDTAQGFILPLETKYIMFLSKDFKTRPTRARIELGKVYWERVDKHEVQDWAAHKKERTDITVSNIKLSLSPESNNSSGGTNQVDFDVYNRTAFNFYQVDFVVLLMRDDNVVGVNRYGLTNFLSMAGQHVNLAWPGVLDPTATITVIPEVNIMDSSVYMKFESNPIKSDIQEIE